MSFTGIRALSAMGPRMISNIENTEIIAMQIKVRVPRESLSERLSPLYEESV
jgi:hypothetical protein